jgi:hypothetical protein
MENLEAKVDRLRADGVTMRNEIVHGFGGDQVLIEDPSCGLEVGIWYRVPPSTAMPVDPKKKECVAELVGLRLRAARDSASREPRRRDSE